MALELGGHPSTERDSHLVQNPIRRVDVFPLLTLQVRYIKLLLSKCRKVADRKGKEAMKDKMAGAFSHLISLVRSRGFLPMLWCLRQSRTRMKLLQFAIGYAKSARRGSNAKPGIPYSPIGLSV